MFRKLSRLITCAALAATAALLGLPAPRPVHAEPLINVDVNDYLQRWHILNDAGGYVGIYAGNQPVELSPGTYTFGLFNVNHMLFTFAVDSDGNVTPSDSTLATGGAGSLALVTHPVAVDVSGYPGRWYFGDLYTLFAGDQTIHLVIPATYEFGLFNVQAPIFNFTVDAAGSVTPSDPALATGGSFSLALVTHDIAVDMGGYVGPWYFGDLYSLYGGNQIIHAVIPATYDFGLFNAQTPLFQLSVDAALNVTTSDAALATGGPSALTIVTHPIAVEVSEYAGRWEFGAQGYGIFAGNQTVLMPAATYDFGLFGVQSGLFRVTVDTAGMVASLDDHKGIGGPGSLTLITRAIHFDVGGAPGMWSFGDPYSLYSGNQTLCLAPASYDFALDTASFEYTIDNSLLVYLFTITPTSVTIDLGGTLYTVTLSPDPVNCGSLDLPSQALDNLGVAIAGARLRREAHRVKLQASADAARAAYGGGNLPETQRNLCNVLTLVDDLEGRRQITPASADAIREAVDNVAAAIGIGLKYE